MCFFTGRNEIPTDMVTDRKYDLNSFEIQTADMIHPPNRGSLIHGDIICNGGFSAVEADMSYHRLL